MSTTARLSLPYIAPQQAQKQVTYNAAMVLLDQLVQPAVKSRTVTAPPGGPAEGDTYVVAPSATGVWAGKDGKFAAWLNGAWSFTTPTEGWLAYVIDTAELAIVQSGAWASFVTNGGAGLAKLGINTTAGLTNRLAVAADSSLFTGTSHSMTLSKATAADTASLLIEDNFSGRAELGLTGDDAFHLKVSPNGSSWLEALNIRRPLVWLPCRSDNWRSRRRRTPPPTSMFSMTTRKAAGRRCSISAALPPASPTRLARLGATPRSAGWSPPPPISC